MKAVPSADFFILVKHRTFFWYMVEVSFKLFLAVHDVHVLPPALASVVSVRKFCGKPIAPPNLLSVKLASENFGPLIARTRPHEPI